MRVWDLPVERLCRRHLIAQHREIHATWTIITEDKRGYSRHPEVRRWRGRLAALFARHEECVHEMMRRNYRHASPLPREQAVGENEQPEFVDAIEEQVRLLQGKGCDCDFGRPG